MWKQLVAIGLSLLTIGGASADKDWVLHGGAQNDQRFSPLNQINEQTIARLGLAWSKELGTTRGLEATSLVESGIIYTTGAWSVVYAFDAKTGHEKWTYDPKVPRERAYFICCDVVNRGVALHKGKVYLGTLDGRLIALDQQTGAPVWSVQTTDPTKAYSITAAPMIANDKVVIGNAGGEYGVRGYITAYDAETGNQAWRLYTVPGDPKKGFESQAMEAASTTWKGKDWWIAGGGGAPWEGMSYDPDLDLLFFGTGNASTWYRALRGEGDSLYTACILAVKASTGELAWHFQTTPGDSFDYDATQPLMQADLAIHGQLRKVLLQANKNGFFYVLDRQTGEFLSGAPFVSGITWASGIDPKTGRPNELPGVASGNPTLVSPDSSGAHTWNPMAFHPATGLVYFPARAGTQMVHAPDKRWKYNPDRDNVGIDGRYEGPLFAKMSAMQPPTGELLAWNPIAQKSAWRAKYPVVDGAGVLATGGNLVFQGRADGIFAAYRATDGEQLWRFDAGTGIMAPPVTYTIDGIQYVTILAGWGGAAGLMNLPGQGPTKPGYGRILTFVLDGAATLKPLPFGHAGPPVPAITAKQNPQAVHEGAVLFNGGCFLCHGLNAVAGPLPDLRYSSKEVLESMEPIVLGGSRAADGMPSFQKILTSKEVQAIRSYIIARAQESAKPTQASEQR
ncbi:MAG TPA: PQQ-dependent dehydrogenase, methanol/ethanol family [Bryobacteraceae bacterium]|nr:PQQ-dependent dehydrogenase, methanol/ethanol family [Bryobacteraceae bacterium]